MRLALLALWVLVGCADDAPMNWCDQVLSGKVEVSDADRLYWSEKCAE